MGGNGSAINPNYHRLQAVLESADRSTLLGPAQLLSHPVFSDPLMALRAPVLYNGTRRLASIV
jgi:hypothetical protein